MYGKEDRDKVELCKDIAGLRNHRGGVIVLGVGEKSAVANGCPEVPLSDAEERRMRSIVASGTAPHAAFEIRSVEGETPGKGFYLLIAEASPARPHAVLVEEGLRYPRRDGTTTRYLSETEVADMYRDRFRGEKQQVDRLEQITEETIAHLDKSDDQRAWLALSLVPNSPGNMAISFAGQAEIEQWARKEHATRDLIDGFFPELPPIVGVSVQRYTLTSPADHGKPSRYPYASCFTDGAASVAARIHTGIHGATQPVVFAPNLVWATAASLRIAGRHAVRNAGARGDAAVELRLFGPHMLLGYTQNGFIDAYPNSLVVREARARLTLPLQSLAGDPQTVLVATRLALTQLFNAFGRAEVAHVTPEGAVRTRYFPREYGVTEWAELRGVPTTDEAAPE